MEKKQKPFVLDGDTLYVDFAYDEACGVYIGDYPFFEEEPRVTPGGRPWRNVTYDGCAYAAGSYGDCGTCPHLRRQSPEDLIGVCFNDALRRGL